MPALKNPRHETFAYEIAKGSSAVDAYRNAGYSERGAGQSAHKLLKKAEIQHRIDAIRHKIAAKSDICAEDVVRMLIEDRELARENGQAAAAIQADMGIAKVLGFITNKSETRVEVGFTFSPEEALAKLEAPKLVDVTPVEPARLAIEQSAGLSASWSPCGPQGER